MGRRIEGERDGKREKKRKIDCKKKERGMERVRTWEGEKEWRIENDGWRKRVEEKYRGRDNHK